MEDLRSIIERACAGDPQAFAEAAERARSVLEAFVRVRLGARLRREVTEEDVLQETWAQALGTVDRFRWAGEGSFTRWLKGIADHVILNVARRKRRGPIVYLERDVPSSDPGASTAARREERLERLMGALSALPEDYRRALVLVRLDGLPVKEAATRMGRTPKAVAHLLSRAIARVRATLDDSGSLRLPPGCVVAPDRVGPPRSCGDPDNDA